MNHFGHIFHFSHWLLFSRNFWIELERTLLSIRQGSKLSYIRAPMQTTSGLLILMHGVVSLQDATSYYENAYYMYLQCSLVRHPSNILSSP